MQVKMYFHVDINKSQQLHPFIHLQTSFAIFHHVPFQAKADWEFQAAVANDNLTGPLCALSPFFCMQQALSSSEPSAPCEDCHNGQFAFEIFQGVPRSMLHCTILLLLMCKFVDGRYKSITKSILRKYPLWNGALWEIAKRISTLCSPFSKGCKMSNNISVTNDCHFCLHHFGINSS